VRRPIPLLFLSLTAALAGFGVLADRALVREAVASAELSSARAGQDARAAALSVRGALGQIEQDLLAGRSPAGVRQQTLALSPGPSVSVGRPYRGRPRAELSRLLLSTEATASGLPEAVVATVALDARTSRPDVVERLLTGQLPVRPEDLPHLASLLGAGGDPRVADLQRRLRNVPDPSELPQAPAFRRRLGGEGAIEGWTRRGRVSLRYQVPARALFEQAGVAERASVVTGSKGAGATTGTSVPVPDVDGLVLAMVPAAAPRGRLLAARGLLWLAVVACLVALGLVRHALDREARAVSREKAFLAGVTHELRTPVASIRVFGEALAEGAGDPREYGVLLVEESQRLEALVERTLASTRVDEAPRFAAVRPRELLDSVVALMRPAAQRRGVTLSVRADEDVGDVCWDADAVRRALLNLIENAIKHGRPNGRVEASAHADGEHVRLSVRDDGPGIGRRDHRRLFGRFERGATEAPGAGLGLYLVDQVASAHGGRVDLTSGEGQGCTFTLVLPRRPPTPEPARRPEPAA
jgi:anti-sigma regulatory factor (Ser/Thr protein kinase)